MNSYYSSDEEVAWGPVTLREIKGDFKRARKPQRRYTIQTCLKSTTCPKVIIEPPTFCEEMEEKGNASSTCDEYYSPNESALSYTNDKNDLVQESSVYLTASDTKTTMDSRSASAQSHNDTHVNFVNAAMNRASYFDIQNFHHTLVEPTMLTPEKSFSHGFCPNNSTESQEEVIVISSDEDESTDSDKDIKREKYSYFADESVEDKDFPEKNRSLREIEEDSMYMRDKAMDGGTTDTKFKNYEFKCDTSSGKGNSSYQSTSSGNVEENDCESSDEVACADKSVFSIKKRHEKSFNESFASNSDSSDDVLCIDDDQEASYVEENKMDVLKEHSVHETNDIIGELCEDIRENTLSGRKSRKSFVNENNYSSSSDERESVDDNTEPATDSLRESHTEQHSNYDDDSSERNDEKEMIHHGIVEFLDRTDLLKSEHRPRTCNISPVTIPNIDLTQFDDTYDGLSQLNDTMEMMDRLLNQAGDTSYSGGQSSDRSSDKPGGGQSSDRSSDKPGGGSGGGDDIISASFLQKPTSGLSIAENRVSPLKNRVENVKISKTTPNGRCKAITPLKARQPDKITPGKSCKSQIPKLRKSPCGDNFKMPATPLGRQRIPTRTCPNFHNIVSPVGMYIRYSPQPVLKQNVESSSTPGRVNFDPPPVSPAPQALRKNKENLDLPSVVYKPGRKQNAIVDKKQALPPSLKKMIKEPDLTKHHRKRVPNKSASMVRRELDEGVDLTRSAIGDSLLEDPAQDMSVLQTRDRPFQKTFQVGSYVSPSG